MQKKFHVYGIQLPEDHPHYVLSDFFSKEGAVARAIEMSYPELANKLKEKGKWGDKEDQAYSTLLSKFGLALYNYSLNYKSTTETQVKGPIKPEYITYITPGQRFALTKKNILKFAA